MAQNAVGIWRSDSLDVVPFSFGNYPAGTAGSRVWQTLPPDLLTHFRAGAAALRELDFRGFEVNVIYTNASAPWFSFPSFALHGTTQNPVHPTRFVPDYSLTYFNIPAIPAAIPGGSPNCVFRLGIDFGPGAALPVPAGSPAGGALALVWNDYQIDFGAGNDLQIVTTTTEPTTGRFGKKSFSGFTTANSFNRMLPNFIHNGSLSSGEFCVTWLFDQSMVQPIRAQMILGGTDNILGGGPPPGPGYFAIDDGRGALYPRAGDVLSYTINAAGHAGLTVIPLVLDSNNLTAADPAPEQWPTGKAYVYKTSYQKLYDDIVSSAQNPPGSPPCIPATGAVANPADSNIAIYCGFDLPTFNNPGVYLNVTQFGDVTGASTWSGDVQTAYDSLTNPLGLLGRNIINLTGASAVYCGASGSREHRTLIFSPQAGWAPTELALGSPDLGLLQMPNGPAGRTYTIQCLIFDKANCSVVDISNAAVVRVDEP